MSTLEIQQTLSELGYDPGPIDGQDGPQTRDAVRDFQRDNGLDEDGIAGPATQAALDKAGDEGGDLAAPFPLPPVIARAKELGHRVWGDPLRLWLFGIRSPVRQANQFDDILGCAVVTPSRLWEIHYWPGTTDPGSHYLVRQPLNPKGTAILAPGQYLDTWTIDLHTGKYEALCQRNGEVSVYRDDTGDDKLDLDPATIETGYFGINLHASTQKDGGEASEVNRYSAGCQVHSSAAGFAKMMELATLQSKETWRHTFSYTLLDQWW